MRNAFMQYLFNIVQLEKTIYEENMIIEGIDAELQKEIPYPIEEREYFHIRWKPLIPILAITFFVSFVAAWQHFPPTHEYFLLCPISAAIYISIWFIVFLVKRGNTQSRNSQNKAIYKRAFSESEARKIALRHLRELSIRERNSTSNVLRTYYDEGLIYPKYRTFEQVAQIYEYLDSGRCSSLTGYAGAYNLLETERMNHQILLELREIRINTAQIAANQHILYNAINEGFSAVTSLLSKSLSELKNINNSIDTQGKSIHTDMLEQRKYLDFVAENTAIPAYFRENHFKEQQMTRWMMNNRGLRGI